MKVLCPTATRDELLYTHLSDGKWVIATTMDWIWTITGDQQIELRAEKGYVICDTLEGPLYTLLESYSVGEYNVGKEEG